MVLGSEPAAASEVVDFLRSPDILRFNFGWMKAHNSRGNPFDNGSVRGSGGRYLKIGVC